MRISCKCLLLVCSLDQGKEAGDDVKREERKEEEEGGLNSTE